MYEQLRQFSRHWKYNVLWVPCSRFELFFFCLFISIIFIFIFSRDLFLSAVKYRVMTNVQYSSNIKRDGRHAHSIGCLFFDFACNWIAFSGTSNVWMTMGDFIFAIWLILKCAHPRKNDIFFSTICTYVNVLHEFEFSIEWHRMWKCNASTDHLWFHKQ